MPDYPEKINFSYIKSGAFRVIHVDGCIGGPTPRGLIFASFYSERIPIPQTTSHPVLADGSLGEELPEARSSKAGIVREIEVGLALDLESAQQLHAWLGKNIEMLQKLQKVSAELRATSQLAEKKNAGQN